MKRFFEFFVLGAHQRSGVIWLATLLTLLLLFRQYHRPPAEPILLNKELMQNVQQQLDSTRKNRNAQEKKIYPFNPNFLTDYRAYLLDIPTEAYDRLRKHREQGRWINSVAQFGQVTGIEDSLLKVIAPYLKFPDWVGSNKNDSRLQLRSATTHGPKKELNEANEAELQEVYGIGEVLSRRIIRQRERLGGFASIDQLYGIYGLSDSVVMRIKRLFTIRKPAEVKQFNINKVSASDLSTISGISFELGRRIWEFVRLRNGIASLSELEKVEGLTPRLLRLIAVYLYIE